MKVERKRMGDDWMGVVVLTVVLALVVVFSGVALAQTPPNYVILTEPVKISAEPASIPADGVSTSEIVMTVINPKVEDIPKLAELEGYDEIFGGQPAGNTRMYIKTSLGTLTDAEDMNNTGKEISVYTGDSGMATVLLSGNETGMANITAEAVSIGNLITSIPENDTTLYIVRNSTEVEFIEAGETPAAPPSGGGDSGNGGIPPTPPAGTQPYIDLNANPADIPADGTSTSTLTVSVWDGEEWVLENHTVNFSTSLGSITVSAPIENGTAIAVLTAGLEEGAAAITAEANLGGDVGTVTNTTTIYFTTPGVTPTPPVVTSTPTGTISLTPAATVTPSPSPTPKPGIPGFEAVFAIAGLLSVAYLVLRRERKV